MFMKDNIQAQVKGMVLVQVGNTFYTLACNKTYQYIFLCKTLKIVAVSWINTTGQPNKKKLNEPK